MKSSKHYFKQIYRIFLYKFNAVDALLTILLLTDTLRDLPPAHMQDLWLFYLVYVVYVYHITTTFFGLSGRPVRKDEPEPVAAGGDEEVREDRASMNKCKA